MKCMSHLLIVAALLFSAHSIAGENPQRQVLVELFSSQGCDSCPSADATLSKNLEALQKNAVVLTWHVDYWDYLGWRDTWASRATTDRQRQYLRVRKLPTLLTPQFFVNGAPLDSSALLLDRVKVAQSDADIRIELSITPNGSELHAEFGLARIDNEIAWPDTLRATPILFQREGAVTPTTGENRGTELRSINIVRAIGPSVPAARAVGRKASAVFTLPDSLDASKFGVAILVEDSANLRSYACQAVLAKP